MERGAHETCPIRMLRLWEPLLARSRQLLRALPAVLRTRRPPPILRSRSMGRVERYRNNDERRRTNRKRKQMKITSKRLDHRSRSYIIESPFYGERVNIITDQGTMMKHCILMIGCNGIQIERREFAKLLRSTRRQERAVA